MGRMSVGAWVGALLVSVALVGCSGTPGEPGGPQDPEGVLAPVVDAGDRQAQDLPQVTVERDDLAQRDDLVLSTRVSLKEVLAKATAGSSPEEGEEFALAASLYLGDENNGRVGPKEIATLVAADEWDVAEYIHTQMGIPERIGAEPARIDPSEQPWLRTEVVEPGLTRTSLALYIRYPGFFEGSDGTWVIFVTESRHRDGAWQLTYWINHAGPLDRSLGERQLEIYFDAGKGWRRPRF